MSVFKSLFSVGTLCAITLLASGCDSQAGKTDERSELDIDPVSYYLGTLASDKSINQKCAADKMRATLVKTSYRNTKRARRKRRAAMRDIRKNCEITATSKTAAKSK